MFNQTLFILAQALLTLAAYFMVARFVLQLVRADFYNPISQAIVKITDPVLSPVRKLIPPAGTFDFASLIGALAVQIALSVALRSIAGYELPDVLSLMIVSFGNLVRMLLNVYFFALIVSFVLSWIAPNSFHPGAVLIHQVTEPLLAPVRKVIPPMAGLDFSILVVFLLISIIRNVLLQGVPPY